MQDAIREAHAAGGYRAVLRLAQEKQLELSQQLTTLTAGHELRRELHSQIRRWGILEDQVREPAANEEHGWTLQPDGSYAKVLTNGKVLASWSGSIREEDGQIVDTVTRDERWMQQHRRHTRQFGEQVRAERLSTARRHAPPRRTRSRSREYRPGATRRAASSSTSSSSDPGDPDSEPASRRGDLRHVSFALTAFLRSIARAS